MADKKSKTNNPAEVNGSVTYGTGTTKIPWASLKLAASVAHRTKKPKGKVTGTTQEGTTKESVTKAQADAVQPSKLSALDAAAKVLQESGQPMSCQEMIQAMAAKRYWSSPAGKTPASTLYAAITRETKTKGKQARFKKSGRGQFVYQTPQAS
jgi:hypothetical protein